MERAVDHFPPPWDGLAYLFVPHEYVPLVMPSGEPSSAHLAALSGAVHRQRGTHWFEETAAIAARCAWVVDINREGVRELADVGSWELPPLGYVPEWDRWGGDATTERAIAVTFMGGYTQRRAETLAASAPVLAGERASLHLFESVIPTRPRRTASCRETGSGSTSRPPRRSSFTAPTWATASGSASWERCPMAASCSPSTPSGPRHSWLARTSSASSGRASRMC